jgi:uncharacterized membrane protein YdjX (TVP38/TMEM64 family)
MAQGVHATNRSLAARLAAAGLLALLVFAATWSYATGGVVHTVFRHDLSAAEKLERLQQFFASLGPAAPLAYVAMVTGEVVLAPLPGLMLYAPGGAIFGGFWGGLLSTAGNTIGAGIACQVMRSLGRPYFERLLERDSLRNYETRLVRSGVWIVFLLRINPLTSSDLVSYAAGATSVPVWKVMLGTLLGMAPLCWAQAYLADEVLTAYPWLLYPLLFACAIYTLVIVWMLRKLPRQMMQSELSVE